MNDNPNLPVPATQPEPRQMATLAKRRFKAKEAA